MGLTIVIELPLPPAGVTAHNTGTWHQKAGKIREYRATGRFMGLSAKRHQGDLAGYQVRIHQTWNLGKTDWEQRGSSVYYRPRDVGNAIQALKPAIDGLVDAGILSGDDHTRVQWGTYTLTKEGRPGVVLTIEAVKPL